MNTTKIKEKVDGIVWDVLGVRAPASSNLVEDLNADSLDIFHIVDAINDYWGVDTNERDELNPKTIQDLYDYAEKLDKE